MANAENITKRQQWESRIRERHELGLARSTYCEERGLSSDSMGYWERKLRSEELKAPSSFVPVFMDSVQHELVGRVRIRLCDRVWIDMDRLPEPAWLAYVVQATGV